MLHMGMQRTSVILDDEARQAIGELSEHFRCSAAAAIRRAVIAHRDRVFGVRQRERAQRVRQLETLFDLFEDHDAAAEVRGLKEQDAHF